MRKIFDTSVTNIKMLVFLCLSIYSIDHVGQMGIDVR